MNPERMPNDLRTTSEGRPNNLRTTTERRPNDSERFPNDSRTIPERSPKGPQTAPKWMRLYLKIEDLPNCHNPNQSNLIISLTLRPNTLVSETENRNEREKRKPKRTESGATWGQNRNRNPKRRKMLKPRRKTRLQNFTFGRNDNGGTFYL